MIDLNKRMQRVDVELELYDLAKRCNIIQTLTVTPVNPEDAIIAAIQLVTKRTGIAPVRELRVEPEYVVLGARVL